jgi:hypothetical protein
VQLETPLMKEILLQIGSRPDVRLWRNNVGAAKGRGKQGREYFVRFGLPGSADLSGLLANGRRLEVEVKRPKGGRHAEEQKSFGAMIERFGGLYVLARSVDDVERAVNTALYGMPRRPA